MTAMVAAAAACMIVSLAEVATAVVVGVAVLVQKVALEGKHDGRLGQIRPCCKVRAAVVPAAATEEAARVREGSKTLAFASCSRMCQWILFWPNLKVGNRSVVLVMEVAAAAATK